MRCAALFVFAASLPAGCAPLIARSGENPEQLTKERVAQEFGAPVARSNPDGTSVLTFHTHQKIAEPARIDDLMAADLLTSGVAELVNGPIELVHATRTALFGRQIMVRYDLAGRVLSVAVDDVQVYRKPYTAHEIEPNAAPKPPEEPAPPVSGP